MWTCIFILPCIQMCFLAWNGSFGGDLKHEFDMLSFEIKLIDIRWVIQHCSILVGLDALMSVSASLA